jgi:hypothetical protein
MEAIDLSKLAAPFSDDQLDWRPTASGKNSKGPWAMLGAYVDARAVQDRLDAVCGAGNWQDTYTHIAGKDGDTQGVVCRLSIRIGGEWVYKEDGSEPTNIEGFKGAISKALVRAASKWGIGRYLYNLDSIFAEIVAKGTPDAKYAKIHDKVKKEDLDIYYLVPKLNGGTTVVRGSAPASTSQSSHPQTAVTEESAKTPQDLYTVISAKIKEVKTAEELKAIGIRIKSYEDSKRLLKPQLDTLRSMYENYMKKFDKKGGK